MAKGKGRSKAKGAAGQPLPAPLAAAHLAGASWAAGPRSLGLDRAGHLGRWGVGPVRVRACTFDDGRARALAKARRLDRRGEGW